MGWGQSPPGSLPDLFTTEARRNTEILSLSEPPCLRVSVVNPDATPVVECLLAPLERRPLHRRASRGDARRARGTHAVGGAIAAARAARTITERTLRIVRAGRADL